MKWRRFQSPGLISFACFKMMETTQLLKVSTQTLSCCAPLFPHVEHLCARAHTHESTLANTYIATHPCSHARIRLRTLARSHARPHQRTIARMHSHSLIRRHACTHERTHARTQHARIHAHMLARSLARIRAPKLTLAPPHLCARTHARTRPRTHGNTHVSTHPCWLARTHPRTIRCLIISHFCLLIFVIDVQLP